MELNKVKNEVFFVDGTLRDIVVENTNKTDWEQFISFAEDFATSTSLTFDSKNRVIEEYSIEELFEYTKEYSVLLKVIVSDIHLHSYFFDEKEIEIDIDPREVNSNAKINIIEVFLTKLAWRLNKEISFYNENSRDEKLYTIKPYNH